MSRIKASGSQTLGSLDQRPQAALQASNQPSHPQRNTEIKAAAGPTDVPAKPAPTAWGKAPTWGQPHEAQAAYSGASSQSGSDCDEDAAAAGGVDRFSNAVFQEFNAGLQEAPDVADENGVYREGLQRVKEHLHSARSRAAVCLICLENMRNDAAVWTCSKSCHCMFHLLCIQSWSRQQLAANALRAEQRLNPDRFPVAAKAAREAVQWACPKCRAEYGPGEVPTEYRCFCGKERDPKFDPWLTPHSCGSTCGRALPSGCGHTCVLLCHPGACPPCPRLITAACYCGKQSARQRCGQHAFSCNKLCGRSLPCGHRCPLRCHAGDCPDCSLTGTYRCACGAESRKLPCSQRQFHCAHVCGKPLACGRHTCDQVCHAGECGGCPLEGPRTCPCGKVAYDELRCDEEAPTCGNTCDNLLPCGQHRCPERCHTGPCSATCRAITLKSCHCGKTQTHGPCFEAFRCERRCVNIKPCGRHVCKRRCCDGNCPPCEEVCNRRLPCGNHKCPAPCHQGPCLPCPLTAAVKCPCGQTGYSLPCGAEKRAVAPKCSHPCVVPRTCRHADQLPAHRCHFGPCPPCKLGCGTPRPCGHACDSPCHDPLLPPVPQFAPPPTPTSDSFAMARTLPKTAIADLPAAVQVAAEVAASPPPLSACPPCQAPVGVACLGKHVVQQQPCSAVHAFSCGAACGRALSCGNHTCQKACHVVPGEAANGEAAEPCDECTRPCERVRECGHACPLPCHSAQPCPPCEVEVERSCHCGRSLVAVVCHALQQEEGQDELLCCGKACHKALPRCPHLCQATCHPGACPGAADCQEEVTIRCPCRRMKSRIRCQAVQVQLADEGKPEGYDATTVLRLLSCDAECEAAKKKRSKADLASMAEPAGGQASSSLMEPAATAAATAKQRMPSPPVEAKGSRRRTRADREREREVAEAKARKLERRKKFERWLYVASQVLLTVLFAWLAWLALRWFAA